MNKINKITVAYHFDHHSDDHDDYEFLDEEDLEYLREKSKQEHERKMNDQFYDVLNIGIRV